MVLFAYFEIFEYLEYFDISVTKQDKEDLYSMRKLFGDNKETRCD